MMIVQYANRQSVGHIIPEYLKQKPSFRDIHASMHAYIHSYIHAYIRKYVHAYIHTYIMYRPTVRVSRSAVPEVHRK